jgi:hypothetical protein
MSWLRVAIIILQGISGWGSANLVGKNLVGNVGCCFPD